MYNFFIIAALLCAISSQNILAMGSQGGNERKKAIELSSLRSSQEEVVPDEKIWMEGKNYEQSYSGPEDENFSEEHPVIHVIDHNELLCVSGLLGYGQLEEISKKYKVRTIVTLDQSPEQDLVGALQYLSIRESRDEGFRSENKNLYKFVHIPIPDGLVAKKHVETLYKVFSENEVYPPPVLVYSSGEGGKTAFAAGFWQLMIKKKSLDVVVKNLMFNGSDPQALDQNFLKQLMSLGQDPMFLTIMFMVKLIASKKMNWSDKDCTRMYAKYVGDQQGFMATYNICVSDICCSYFCSRWLYESFMSSLSLRILRE